MQFDLIEIAEYMVMIMVILEEEGGGGGGYEKYDDDLDVGGGFGISSFDHSLEPVLTPPNISTSLRSILQNWAEHFLTRTSLDLGMLRHMISVAMSFSCKSCVHCVSSPWVE